MHTVIYPKSRTTRELRKRIPHVHGFTTVPDGWEEIYYETSIDLDALHTMAREAAGNKGQTSKDGPLKVRIVERHRLEQGSTLTPVVAILTVFSVGAVLIAQSGLVNALLARFAEVVR